jgi:serine/threonine protein kinase
LGITAIEMAEGKPPLHGIHPMRAIFMIPNKPPPSFSDKGKWSEEFLDFVAQCLQKNAAERPTSKDLLKHKFIQKAKSTKILTALIDQMNQVFSDAGGRQEYFKKKAEEKQKQSANGNDSDEDDDDETGSETSEDSETDSDDDDYGTIKKKATVANDDDDDDDECGTIQRKPNVKSPSVKSPDHKKNVKQESDSEDDDDSDDSYGGTMVRHSVDTIKNNQETNHNAEEDSVTNLSVFYDRISVEDLQSQLEKLDVEMEQEIEKVRTIYARRKRAIENSIQKQQKQ